MGCMDSQIATAVNDRRTLRFIYKGDVREVEPHTYGQLKSGKDGLCAWQVSGGSGSAFRLFLEDEITTLTIAHSDKFDVRPGYKRGDDQFARIYAEL